MNFVYILMVHSYTTEKRFPHGAYSTKEKAERAKKRVEQWGNLYCWIDHLVIDEDE